MIMTYTRDHILAINDLAIKTWIHVRHETRPAQGQGLQSTKSSVFLKFKGKISSGIVSSLNDLE